MSGGKYLVMANGDHGEYAVVFNDTESHQGMARKLGGEEYVLGAGFVVVVGEECDRKIVRCFGKSVTLKKESRGREDAFLVAYAVFGTASGVDLGA